MVKKNTSMVRRIVVGAIAALLVVQSVPCAQLTVKAKESTETLTGQYYVFEKDNKYDISGGAPVTDSEIGKPGSFSLFGDMKTIADQNGVKAYEVIDGNITLNYEPNSALVNAAEDKWHIVEDKIKKVDGISLENDVLKGTIILQTSLNGEKWVNEAVFNNFTDASTGFEKSFYSTRNIQQINGCYFRIIVVYKVAKKIEDKKIVFVNVDNYEEKRVAETYEFYLIDSNERKSTATLPTTTPRKEDLGTKVKTGKDNGFAGTEAITAKDPHYGWDIGKFFINGYTRETNDPITNEQVFLKNVGDKVTLWFSLNQDIDCLNGNENYSINEDKNGSDQYFEVPKTNFKRGAMIIRFKDFEGKKTDPIIYTDFLAANALTGVNTKVELFEEGDYEVALDYEIVNNQIIDSVTDYRIFFTFQIRNGNCMVYPFDTQTGSELVDNAITPNGFKLDMAKSRYLTIDVSKSTVKGNAGSYSLDERFNKPAKDGDAYTEEGIYTFTVKNKYTGAAPTTKVIYVGDTPIHKALASGKTVTEINELIAEGAELQEDGTLLLPEPDPVPEEEDTSSDNSAIDSSFDVDKQDEKTTDITRSEVDNTNNSDNEDKSENLAEDDGDKPEGTGGSNMPIVIVSILAVVVIGTGIVIGKKKKEQ